MTEPQAGAGVLLLSGGIESVTLLWMLADQRPQPVFIDYGQRAAEQELACARWQCEQLQMPLKVLEMASLGEGFRAGQVKRLHVPIPHRNLVAMSVVLSYAALIGEKDIYLSLNREDTQAYPSASTDFLDTFQLMSQTLGDFLWHFPLLELSKAEVIRQGRRLGVDYQHSYSCLLGYPEPCGRCPQCEARQAAFRQADQ